MDITAFAWGLARTAIKTKLLAAIGMLGARYILAGPSGALIGLAVTLK